MSTFPSQVSTMLHGPRVAAQDSIPRASLVSSALLPLLVAAVLLASAAGLVPASRTDLGIVLVFILVGALMAVIAFRFNDVFEMLRLRNIRRPGPSIEAFDTRDEFIERLEELTAGSRQVCFLDSSNVAEHLIGAPRFLGPRCCPRKSYRHIARVESPGELESLILFLRGHREAEKGTCFCVDEDPLFFTSVSYCVVEQDDDDSCDVFLIHDEARDWAKAQVVLVRDRVFGHFMLKEYDRLWKQLEESQEPLLRAGELHTGVEIQLQSALAGEPRVEPLARAA